MSGLALPAALNTGCISTEQTVYHDQERVKVEFENHTAGKLSTKRSASSKTGVAGARQDGGFHPRGFRPQRRVVEGESIAFNRAVRHRHQR
jgi:hypothetical protein